MYESTYPLFVPKPSKSMIDDPEILQFLDEFQQCAIKRDIIAYILNKCTFFVSVQKKRCTVFCLTLSPFRSSELNNMNMRPL